MCERERKKTIEYVCVRERKRKKTIEYVCVRERRQLSVSERQRGYILLRDIHTYIHFKFKKKI